MRYNELKRVMPRENAGHAVDIAIPTTDAAKTLARPPAFEPPARGRLGRRNAVPRLLSAYAPPPRPGYPVTGGGPPAYRSGQRIGSLTNRSARWFYTQL